MRSLFVVLLLFASAAFAQTPTNAPPQRVSIMAIPMTGDPLTVPPVGFLNSVISQTSTLCNLAPAKPAVAPIVNPSTAGFDDPFTLGRECRVPIPTGLPDGQYRLVSSFFSDLCVIPPTTNTVTCEGPRSAVAPVPFSVVSPRLPPAAPTGLRVQVTP